MSNYISIIKYVPFLRSSTSLTNFTKLQRSTADHIAAESFVLIRESQK